METINCIFSKKITNGWVYRTRNNRLVEFVEKEDDKYVFRALDNNEIIKVYKNGYVTLGVRKCNDNVVSRDEKFEERYSNGYMSNNAFENKYFTKENFYALLSALSSTLGSAYCQIDVNDLGDNRVENMLNDFNKIFE